MKKTNYFYIDETGHVNNDSSIFVYGCIKTDTPLLIEKSLNNLKEELSEDALLIEFGKKILENNFHATGDPFDVRTPMFRLLPYLNFRSYFTVLKKNDEYYKNLKSNKEDFEIIESMIRKLIVPRITKNKKDVNKFYFETLEIEDSSLEKVLHNIFSPLYKKYDVEYFIVGKENSNMPVIDYINFIINKILTTKKDNAIPDWVLRAFKVLKDKIALIHFQNDDSFYSRHGNEDYTIEINNLKKMAVD